jgi:hypothetical protein
MSVGVPVSGDGTVQVRIGEVLLGLDGYLLTVVAPQWEPGIFLKHVERLEVAVGEPDRHGVRVVTIGTGGGPVPWEVLRVPVPAERYAALGEFLAAVDAARSSSTADVGREK